MSEQQKKDGYERDKDGRLTITADGETYILEPLDIQVDFAALEKHMMELNKKTLADMPEEMAAKLERLKAFPRLQNEMMDRFYRDLKAGAGRRPTRQEMFEWIDTRDGLIWTITRQLRKQRPDLDEKAVYEILTKAGLGEESKMAALRDKANPKLAALADAAAEAGITTEELMRSEG